jgi:hypothetical protein
MLNRRDFLKMIGAFGFVLTPLNKLLRNSSFGLQGGGSSEGELYEGFVLLDQDAPIPFFVEGTPCPILCQIDETEAIAPELDAYRGDTQWFDNIENLKDNIDFHLFVPGSLPHKMTFLQGYIIRFAGSGEVWEARIDFGFEEDREPLVTLSARPIFARPYPVWPVLTYPKKEAGDYILDEEYVVKKPEKVAFTPKRGVMLPTDQGFMMQWIKKDVLYSMFMEYDGWRGKAEAVGKSLVEK